MRSSMVGYPSAFLGSWSIVNPVGNIKGHVDSALDLESYKYYGGVSKKHWNPPKGST